MREKNISAYNQVPIWWILDRYENLTSEHVWDLEYLPVTAGRMTDGFVHLSHASYFNVHASKSGWNMWVPEQIEGCRMLLTRTGKITPVLGHQRLASYPEEFHQETESCSVRKGKPGG